MSITIIITVVTVAISILAFYNERFMDQLIFHPYSIGRNNEWYKK